LLIYGIKKLKLAGLRLERFDPEYSPLIPDPLGSNTSGVLDDFRLILMDLGSVIVDCE